jgi:serralysin
LLFAEDGEYTFNGGAGNDSLLAWSCGGTLNGGDGNDRLENSGGDVTLNGGAGNDVLITDNFNPITMTGGTGSDIFQLVDFEDTVITDFNGAGAAVGDQIDLRGIDPNGNSNDGNQAFTYIGGAAFTAAGQLRYAGGILSGSTDGDTASEFQIQLVGGPTLVVGGAGTDILL